MMYLRSALHGQEAIWAGGCAALSITWRYLPHGCLELQVMPSGDYVCAAVKVARWRVLSILQSLPGGIMQGQAEEGPI